jgi:CsoR family transcriptional regulator, copper-sensing transcriptional repressor
MLDNKLKLRTLHRCKIIKGQVEGLLKAIGNEEYCPMILEQSLAIQNSLKSLDGFILENHLKSHVVAQMRSNNGQAVKELMKIYKLSIK